MNSGEQLKARKRIVAEQLHEILTASKAAGPIIQKVIEDEVGTLNRLYGLYAPVEAYARSDAAAPLMEIRRVARGIPDAGPRAIVEERCAVLLSYTT